MCNNATWAHDFASKIFEGNRRKKLRRIFFDIIIFEDIFAGNNFSAILPKFEVKFEEKYEGIYVGKMVFFMSLL